MGHGLEIHHSFTGWGLVVNYIIGRAQDLIHICFFSNAFIFTCKISMYIHQFLGPFLDLEPGLVRVGRFALTFTQTYCIHPFKSDLIYIKMPDIMSYKCTLQWSKLASFIDTY
jgi:hypothetical protein